MTHGVVVQLPFTPYVFVDADEWRMELSTSPVFARFRVLPAHRARWILQDLMLTNRRGFEALHRELVANLNPYAHLDLRLYSVDYLIEKVGLDPPYPEKGLPWHATLYLLEYEGPQYVEPPPPRDYDKERQEALAAVRAGPKGYVVFEFVTEDGVPVSGLRCEVLLADGEFLTRSSDSNGQLRLDNIPQGNCHLRLPTLDGSAWRPEAGSPGTLVEQSRMTGHVVRRDETLGHIAQQYKIKQWKAVWEDDRNAPLREQRKLPNLVRAGDVVAIPFRSVHEITRSTDAVHRVILSSLDQRWRLPWST